MSFQYFCDLWEVYIKHVSCILTCDSDLGEKHLCSWLRGWNSLFSWFYLKEQMTKSSYSGLGIWHSLSPKWTKWAWLFKGSNFSVLVTIDKIGAFKWKIRIWQISICYREFEIFSMLVRLVMTSLNVCVIFCLLCLYCIMKCVSVWKICITQRTSIF